MQQILKFINCILNFADPPQQQFVVLQEAFVELPITQPDSSVAAHHRLAPSFPVIALRATAAKKVPLFVHSAKSHNSTISPNALKPKGAANWRGMVGRIRNILPFLRHGGVSDSSKFYVKNEYFYTRLTKWSRYALEFFTRDKYS